MNKFGLHGSFGGGPTLQSHARISQSPRSPRLKLVTLSSYWQDAIESNDVKPGWCTRKSISVMQPILTFGFTAQGLSNEPCGLWALRDSEMTGTALGRLGNEIRAWRCMHFASPGCVGRRVISKSVAVHSQVRFLAKLDAREIQQASWLSRTCQSNLLRPSKRTHKKQRFGRLLGAGLGSCHSYFAHKHRRSRRRSQHTHRRIRFHRHLSMFLRKSSRDGALHARLLQCSLQGWVERV